MGFKLGYDNTDQGQKLHFSYVYKPYAKLISQLTAQRYKPTPLNIHMSLFKAADQTKYGINFKNFFFYNINDSMWRMNLEINKKRKMFKYVNFDIFPNIKLALKNDDYPLQFSVKHGKYQGAREQIIENYDFSKIIKSMLPYHRTGFSTVHSSHIESSILNRNIMSIYRFKCGYNKIHNYEDNIKLSSSLKTLFDITELGLFKIGMSNQITLKKAFINPFKFQSDKKSKMRHADTNDHHITSGFDYKSKVLGINFLDKENTIDNRNSFYIQNYTVFRLKDITYFRDNELLSRLEPYIGIESVFVPHFSGRRLHFKDSLKFLFTLGFSIRLNEVMTIDLSLYSWAKNTPTMKEGIINRFRVDISFSTSID